MKDFKHGASGYSVHKCRCSVCKIANSEYQSAYSKTEKGKVRHSIANKKYLRTKAGKLSAARHYLNRIKDPVYLFKRKAWDAVNYAIESGKIKKEPCKICGDINSQAHHSDYNKPLDIIWLCDQHHRQIHRGDK